MTDLEAQILATLLITLRLGPTFTFAPPFTMLRIPARLRLFAVLSLSLVITGLLPELTVNRLIDLDQVYLAAGREFIVGLTIMIGFKAAFMAILMVGRAIDIQAGYGLALLADPSNASQMPLIGTVLAYAAAVVFFLTDGLRNLFLIVLQSVQQFPISSDPVFLDPGTLGTLIALCFVFALGLISLVLVSLMLVDATVAIMARTLPQMNVLLIGFQVKTLIVLATLPIAIGASASLFLNLFQTVLEYSFVLRAGG